GGNMGGGAPAAVGPPQGVGVGAVPAAPGTAVAMTTPSSASATLVVNLPANATLTIDDAPTVSTTGQRVFQTPALPTDRTFQYTLKATVVRDGQTQTLTRQVTVRGGEATHVSLDLPSAGAVVSP